MDPKERQYLTYLKLGDFYARMNKTQQAIDSYLIAEKTGFNPIAINRRLGNRYLTIGDRDSARKHHKIQLELGGWKQDKGYLFSRDYFYSKNRSQQWKQILSSHIEKPTRYLEIGSREGMSMCWMLDHILKHEMSTAVALDIKFDQYFETNIKLTGRDITSHEIDSKDIISLNLKPFDIIYVDGSHFVDDVFLDCVNSINLLNVGGVMIIDDYKYTNHQQHKGRTDTMPGPGIDAFLEIYSDMIEIVEKGWQVILKKTS